MLKRVVLLFLCSIFIFSVISCGENNERKREEEFGKIAPKKVENQDGENSEYTYKSLNKTYYVDEGEIKGKLYMGVPVEEFKKDDEGKEYIEIKLPMILTNNGSPVVAYEILEKIKVVDGFEPYRDDLELRYEKTGKIIKGNSEEDSEDYFMKIFNTNNGKSDITTKMEKEESRSSYYKFLVYPEEIGVENDDKFKEIKIDSFQFVVPNRDGGGYNILK